MTLSRKLLPSLLAVATAFPATLVGSAANAAPEAPLGCIDRGWHYDVSGKYSRHIPTGDVFRSGKGGTVTATLEYGHEASLQVSSGGSVSASSLVASAEATYGINASTTASRSASYGYSRKISSNKYGNLQFGNWGWGMNFQKYYVNNYCSVSSRTSGTIKGMPSSNTWGFRYWETL